jgi:hypothetical protein
MAINGFVLPMMLRRPRSGFAMFVDDIAARIPGVRNFGGVYTIVGTAVAGRPAQPA